MRLWEPRLPGDAGRARAIVVDVQQGLSLAHKLASEGDQPADALVMGKHAYADIADVIEAARHGDAASIAALEHAAERIGLILAGLVNLLNPTAIVIDGSVVRAGEILLTPLRRVVASASLPAAWNGTRILPGELGVTAIALGAVISVLDAAFSLDVHAVPATSRGADGGILTSIDFT